MVDFGATQFEGDITPSVVEQAPVVDRSAEVLASGLQGPARTIGAIAGSIFEQNQQNSEDLVFADFTHRLVNLANAVEQGELSLAASRTTARSIFNEVIANNPSLSGDLTDLYTSLTGGRIAGLVDEGSEFEQARIDRIQEGIRTGWIDPNNIEGTMGNYTRFQTAANHLAALNAQFGTNEALRTENEAQFTYQMTNALRDTASTAMPWVQNRIDIAIQQLESGEDPAQVVSQLQSDYNSEKASIMNMAQDVDAEWLITPLDTMIEDFIKLANGEYETSTYNSIVENRTAHANMVWRADPEIGPILEAMDILGDNFPTLQNQIAGPALQKLGRMLEGRSFDVIDGTESTQVTLDQASGAIDQYMREGGTEQGLNQVVNQFNSVVRSVAAPGDVIESPRQLRTVMEWLGQENINSFAVQHGGVPANIATQAQRLVREQYEGPLLEAVSARWDGIEIPARISATGVPPMTDILGANVQFGAPEEFIDVVWDGDGVRFMPKAGFEDNTTIRIAVEGLNTGENSIAGPLNTLIRAQATLEGTNDFKGIWERDYANRLFGLGEDSVGDETDTMLEGTSETTTALEALEPFSPDVEQTISGSQGDWYTDPQQARQTLSYTPSPSSLTMEDFNGDINLINDVITSTSASDPQAMVNATTPIEVASAYLGLSEERDQDNITLSRFINKATGQNINPATTAWCAAFVDAVLHEANLGGGTGKLNARSYMNWGTSTDNPNRGDIVVLWRNSPDDWRGHVGFFEGYDEDGNIRVLGGNQSNQVSVQSFSPDRLLGFRKPA